MKSTYHAQVEANRKKFGCFDSLETLDMQPPDFTQDGRSGESERDRLTSLAASHVNQEVRHTELAEWECPRYQHELQAAAKERDVDVEALQSVDESPIRTGKRTRTPTPRRCTYRLRRSPKAN